MTNYIYPWHPHWPMEGISVGVLMLGTSLGFELSQWFDDLHTYHNLPVETPETRSQAGLGLR
ncbi:MAG: hypothetical protein P8L40_00465 [Planktomarina sp.]|nr:hypothetical protein [Planktomarina sp.]